MEEEVRDYRLKCRKMPFSICLYTVLSSAMSLNPHRLSRGVSFVAGVRTSPPSATHSMYKSYPIRPDANITAAHSPPPPNAL